MAYFLITKAQTYQIASNKREIFRTLNILLYLQVKCGVLMNILCILVLTVGINTWGYAYFNLGSLPGWASTAVTTQTTLNTTAPSLIVQPDCHINIKMEKGLSHLVARRERNLDSEETIYRPVQDSSITLYICMSVVLKSHSDWALKMFKTSQKLKKILTLGLMYQCLI